METSKNSFKASSGARTRTDSPSSVCPVSAHSISILHPLVPCWSCRWTRAPCTLGQLHLSAVTQGCSGRQSAPEAQHRQCTGPRLERQGERTKTYHSWPLVCDAAADKAGEMVVASGLASCHRVESGNVWSADVVCQCCLFPTCRPWMQRGTIPLRKAR